MGSERKKERERRLINGVYRWRPIPSLLQLGTGGGGFQDNEVYLL